MVNLLDFGFHALVKVRGIAQYICIFAKGNEAAAAFDQKLSSSLSSALLRGVSPSLINHRWGERREPRTDRRSTQSPQSSAARSVLLRSEVAANRIERRCRRATSVPGGRWSQSRSTSMRKRWRCLRKSASQRCDRWLLTRCSLAGLATLVPPLTRPECACYLPALPANCLQYVCLQSNPIQSPHTRPIPHPLPTTPSASCPEELNG